MNTRLPGIEMIIGMLAISTESLTDGPVLGDTSTEWTYKLIGIASLCGVAGLIKLNALGTQTVARALGRYRIKRVVTTHYWRFNR